MTNKTIIAGFVALAFVTGSIMTTSMAYAAPNGQPFQELWDAIDNLQTQIDSISFVQDDPTEPALVIQVDPSSAEPALEVNDGTNVLFTVNNDGSIQIGSNTVIIRSDGTVDGGPLFLQAGSTVDGQLITTGAHTTDTNAGTLCTAGNYLDGDGTCKPISPSGGGTVTQVNTGSGLTGGPITTSGTISVDNGGITGTHIATGTITSSNVNTSFMKFVRLADDATGNAAGWNPNGSTKLFTITESSIVHTGAKMSVVSISLHDNNFSIFSIPTCSVTNIGNGGPFKIGCNNPPTNGAILGYVVITS